LDSGLPKKEKVLTQRARHLLRLLADVLNTLPEKLEVRNVVLMTDRPVKFGGFSDIYHGQYTSDKGEKVEVALKVLKIFYDQSDSARRILHQKFVREVLAWSYLKR
jgi:hypothetical protein